MKRFFKILAVLSLLVPTMGCSNLTRTEKQWIPESFEVGVNYNETDLANIPGISSIGYGAHISFRWRIH